MTKEQDQKNEEKGKSKEKENEKEKEKRNSHGNEFENPELSLHQIDLEIGFQNNQKYLTQTSQLDELGITVHPENKRISILKDDEPLSSEYLFLFLFLFFFTFCSFLKKFVIN